MELRFAKAARNDGFLGMSWIGFSVIVFFLFLQAIGVLPSGEYYVVVFVSLMALLALVFLWRWIVVRSLFRNGKLAEGIVDKIVIRRDRGFVTFFFILGETFVKTQQPIMWNKTTKALSPGQKVQILYAEKKFKRALIVELYTESGRP
jgi:hypothetical protein